jgi:nucleotidyltransferase substrate binding protein (TIGR01987 family)
MSDPDIRWKQRFENYDRSVARLEEALAEDVSSMSQLAKEGLSKRFELAVELGWKTMKDFMVHQGLDLDIVAPKDVVAAAWRARLIPDGQVWIDMLTHRNLLSHRYDGSQVDEVIQALQDRYLVVFQELRRFFAGRADR